MIFYAYFFCCLSQNNYLCALIFSHLLNMQSHPTWVRGLKPITRNEKSGADKVAPYVGAWIETTQSEKMRYLKDVAPYVGAWIETKSIDNVSILLRVAPYVGAWIETKIFEIISDLKRCRTLRGCVD